MDRNDPQTNGGTRRGVLKLAVLAALVAGSAGISAVLRRGAGPVSDGFEPVPGAPGFRRPATAGALGGNPLLVGLDPAPLAEPLPIDLCRALFPADRGSDQVPMAYFTDARCAICRMTGPLMTELDARPDIALRWHELPLLGPVSEQAARAALAAGLQGAYPFFQKRLMGSPVLATEAFLRDLAREAGIDAERLLEEVHGPAVDRQLRESADLARRFGFVGTPGVVVGDIAVLGRFDRAGMARLIDMARKTPGPC